MTRGARQIIIVIILLMLVFIIIVVGVSISRIGKIGVAVNVIPSDATVMIDGNKANSGTVYLKPGTHTFIASKNGWSNDSQTISITNDNSTVNLLPAPSSDEANNYLQNNPSIESEREQLGSESADSRGNVFRKANPLVNYLPYADVSGPFKIDYSFDNSNNTSILISYSTPNGRKNAINWIKSKGFDPATLNIQFTDFASPLIGGSGE